MPTALPLIILLQHDRWASDALLDACEPLSDEQMQQSFEMGLGTLRATLVHMLGAMQGWGDLLAGRERRPFLEEGTCSRTEMRTMLHELADDLEQSAGAAPLTDTVSAERGGMAYT
ncbi:MAG: DinB family protein, partial [Phycisphaerales bacterium]